MVPATQGFIDLFRLSEKLCGVFGVSWSHWGSCRGFYGTYIQILMALTALLVCRYIWVLVYLSGVLVGVCGCIQVLMGPSGIVVGVCRSV